MPDALPQWDPLMTCAPSHQRADSESATQSIRIHPVEASDIPELLRLLRAKAAFDGAEQSFMATEENLANELFSGSGVASAIVATERQKVVGLATYFQTYSSFLMKPGLWLDDLFVEEACRKRGVGRQLLLWLCREAATSGYARIDWIVAVDNDNGREFYKKMGAIILESARLARFDEQTICDLGGSCR